jgi:hypothetical protein
MARPSRISCNNDSLGQSEPLDRLGQAIDSWGHQLTEVADEAVLVLWGSPQRG